MKTLRQGLCLALGLLLCLTVCAPAIAADAEGEGFVDEEELTAVVERALEEKYGANALVSVAAHFTRTGEDYFYNGDEWYYTASVYKLPMIMRFTRLLAEGDPDGRIPPSFVEQAELIKERCLVYSDNSWAAALWENVFTWSGAVVDDAVDFAQFPRDELPDDFYKHTIFSPRLTLGVLKELYAHPDEYPGVIDYMKQAQPGEYFRGELEGVYEIGQKYGSDEGYNHTAGIIWTPHPVLLVVMSRYLGSELGKEMIAHVAAAVAQYALTVDERADAHERALSEAEAAAQAAAAAQEATPEPESAPTPEPTPAPEAEPTRPGMLRWLGLAVVPLGALALIPARRKKRRRKKRR